MKRLFTILLIAAVAATAWAQKKGAKAASPLTIDENIAAYRFDDAVKQIRAEIQTLKRRRKPTTELEEKLAQAEHLQSVLDATQRIVFVDSMVVPKATFFEHLTLSEESGRITSYERAFRMRDTLGCTVFQAELGNDVYFARPTAHGMPQLCRASLQGGEWSAAEPLAGLDTDDTAQNHPFVLADGMTIYYGAVNKNEGLGGYDIYTSRWDADNKRFLRPENIGMPFNSPANDYMLAIDELNSLGWFVTDRRQPKDTVCIYVFVPAEIRQNWVDAGNVSNEQLAAYARLSSIRATQTDAALVARARERLAQARQGVRQTGVEYDFTFVVSDSKVYHYVSDAKNAEAKRLMAEWTSEEKELYVAGQQLDIMRQQYAKADSARKAHLRTQILAMERDYDVRAAQQRRLANSIRALEK